MNNYNDYMEYLSEHKKAVIKAFDWFVTNMDTVFYHDGKDYLADVEMNVLSHDSSKYRDIEFYPYEEYFYGDGANQDEFDKAWLNHIQNNPHHWQYWILFEDEGKTKVLDMDYPYIIEMICDWWSFSLRQDKPFEIFNWYQEHAEKMKLSYKTRNIVEDILALMEDKLNEE